MAKQLSLKQQIYQQIANKQVQEVLNKQREQETASLMADFNSWQQQRQDPAQLMADFDAWKQQNTPQVQPQEVRQTIPSIADVQPVVHEQTEMEKHIAEVTKAAKEKRLRERAQKLQQLEQIEASQPYTKKERETLAKVEDISKKLTNIIPETEALNTVTKTWKKGQRPEATDTSSQVAARVTNEKKPEIDTTNVPVNVDRWLSPDTKLTEAEKKKAKEYASAELQKVKYGPNKQPLLNTPEERQHYADMVNLINKTNGFTNFMSGAIEVPYNLADILEPDDQVDPSLFASSHIIAKRQERTAGKHVFYPSIWHENKSGNISVLDYSCALRTGASYNYLLVNGVRRPSSRELLRLQGFPEKYKIAVSHQDIRRQTGNSVAVPMIRMVAQKLNEIIKENDSVLIIPICQNCFSKN